VTWTSWPSYTTRYWSRASAWRSWLYGCYVRELEFSSVQFICCKHASKVFSFRLFTGICLGWTDIENVINVYITDETLLFQHFNIISSGCYQDNISIFILPVFILLLFAGFFWVLRATAWIIMYVSYVIYCASNGLLTYLLNCLT